MHRRRIYPDSCQATQRI